MKRGSATALTIAAIMTGTASVPGFADVPRRMPARRPYPKQGKPRGKKNRTHETERRRRQIAAGILDPTCGRAQQCRCAGCRRARNRGRG